MKQDERCAFCTFLIDSDRYLPGILTFAYTLRKQRVAADLICIVTDEVRQNAGTGKSFLRFAVLDIMERQRLGYEKIIICDSDLLPLRNFAELCHYPAPSGILNERKENVIGLTAEGEWIWYDVYRRIPPKTSIPKEITDRVKTDTGNLGVNSVIYIFDRDTIPYGEIETDMNSEEMRALISAFPWPDMQYMTYKLSGKWHNLDIRYASFNSFPSLHAVFGTHYAGLKPWDIHNRSYLHYCGHDDYKPAFFEGKAQESGSPCRIAGM